MRAAGTPSGSSEPESRIVPDHLRSRLAERYGPVVAGAEADVRIRALTVFATCGDRVTADALRLGRMPVVGIVDLKTRRNEPVDPTAFAALAARGKVRVANPPGVLSRALQVAVRETLDRGGGLIEVDGEEDLGALALVAALPLGATVIYGIPGEGVSFVTVTADAKARVRELIEAMEPTGAADGR